MKSINECIEEEGINVIFFRKEMGKTFSLTSDTRFSCKIISIDNCVFQNSVLRRCDFLFLVSKTHENVILQSSLQAFYVELKGVNIQYACEQLYNAIRDTKREIVNYSIEARVISIKGFQPNIANNEYFRKVKKLIKKEIVFHKVHKGNNFTYTHII
ncbi:MAG: hypothetical protein ABI472_21245 [Ginsengibacter sp.]